MKANAKPEGTEIVLRRLVGKFQLLRWGAISSIPYCLSSPRSTAPQATIRTS